MIISHARFDPLLIILLMSCVADKSMRFDYKRALYAPKGTLALSIPIAIHTAYHIYFKLSISTLSLESVSYAMCCFFFFVTITPKTSISHCSRYRRHFITMSPKTLWRKCEYFYGTWSYLITGHGLHDNIVYCWPNHLLIVFIPKKVSAFEKYWHHKNFRHVSLGGMERAHVFIFYSAWVIKG